MKFSRRDWLRILSLAPAAFARTGALGGPLLTGLRGSGANPGKALFEPVPAAKSGITWRHVNGRSSQYYLPETTGAGCAFLHYDNDGWTRAAAGRRSRSCHCGRVETFTDLPIDRYVTIVEGEGIK